MFRSDRQTFELGCVSLWPKWGHQTEGTYLKPIGLGWALLAKCWPVQSKLRVDPCEFGVGRGFQ